MPDVLGFFSSCSTVRERFPVTMPLASAAAAFAQLCDMAGMPPTKGPSEPKTRRPKVNGPGPRHEFLREYWEATRLLRAEARKKGQPVEVLRRELMLQEARARVARTDVRGLYHAASSRLPEDLHRRLAERFDAHKALDLEFTGQLEQVVGPWCAFVRSGRADAGKFTAALPNGAELTTARFTVYAVITYPRWPKEVHMESVANVVAGVHVDMFQQFENALVQVELETEKKYLKSSRAQIASGDWPLAPKVTEGKVVGLLVHVADAPKGTRVTFVTDVDENTDETETKKNTL
jgi:hypothetical protein